MKLVKRTSLVFQEGRSDKVYEVDLCETQPGAFVVNFRYGRRGASMKEGSKTTRAVSLAQAEKVFDDLVSSKTKKGYRDSTIEAPVRQSAPAVELPLDSDARNQAVLNRLAYTSRGKKKWPLERAIWRAGELKIRAAVPLLLRLIGSGKGVRDYSIIWSLGLCGDESIIPAISDLYNNKSNPDYVRRIATEALLKLWSKASKESFRAQLIAFLPDELRELAHNGPAEDFANEVKTYLDTEDHRRFEILDKLYLIDNEHVRPALLEVLKTAPLRNNYFQRFRHIFKAAEYRRDAEVFGILAYRFEKTPAMFTSPYYSMADDRKWTYAFTSDGQYFPEGGKEIKKADSKIGYGSRTRVYLRQRVWRTLKRLGEIKDADYVKMAVGVLLPYSDSDAQAIRQSYIYNPITRDFAIVNWDTYAGYWAFNHMLYGRSPRYFVKPGGRAWRCSAQYKPGDPAPDTREETFPELWDQKPVGLLHLISESECRPVHEFAARALRDCKAFCAALDTETIMMILGRPYEASARLGFDIARERCQMREPDRGLVLAVAHCGFEKARAESRRWIDSNRDYFLSNVDFVVGLVSGPQSDTREYGRKLLRSSVFSSAAARSIISRLISHLASIDSANADRAKDIADTLLAAFSQQLRSIDMKVVLDLLGSSLKEVQELGASILLGHETKPADLPAGVIDSIIASEFDSIRGVGIRLFAGLDTDTLLKNETLIVSFATHEHEDIRNSIRSAIDQLSKSDPQFAERMAALFLQELSGEEHHAGVHRSLAQMLRENLTDRWIVDSTPGTVWRLIQSPSMDAQALGGVLIALKIEHDAAWAENFETSEIVELSNNRIAAVRQSARAVFEMVMSRYKHASNPDGSVKEMIEAVRLLDSEWDDSREYFISQFKSRFGAEDFSPAILVGICDSTRPDVQALGRELITRFFEEESGQEYLLKLSEHPSADLQLFATNYLERYAANDAERLNHLRYYFNSVLSRVNKARVAKDRVIAFLTAEAAKSEEAARIVADIFARQSATIAKGDRAAAIEALLSINRLYPQIVLPIKVLEPEVRRAG